MDNNNAQEQIRNLLTRKGELLRAQIRAGEDRRKEIQKNLAEIDKAIFQIRARVENVVIRRIQSVA